MIVLDAGKPRRLIESLAFAPDGRHLAAGDTLGGVTQWAVADQTAVVWPPAWPGVSAPVWVHDVAAGPNGKAWYAAARAAFFACSPAGPAAGGGRPDPAVEVVRPGWARALAVGPDGRRAAVALVVDDAVPELTGWDLAPDGPPVPVWRAASNAGFVRGLAFLPAGGEFVAACSDWPNRAGALTVRSAADGRVVRTVACPTADVGGVAVSPAGTAVVARCGPAVWVWNPADWGRPPARFLNDSRKHFTGLAFHPAGRYLLATSNDATVKVYACDTWQVAATFTWQVGKLRSVAVSPDGTLAAVGSDTGKIVVWDFDL